jgi:DNA-binding LytR/AlgR family response regulator
LFSQRLEFFLKSAPLHFALREIRQSFTTPLTVAGLVGVAIVLGVSGPFNTLARFDLAARLAYWGAIVFSTYAAGQFGSMVLMQAVSPLPRPLRILLRALAAATAVSAVLQLFNIVLHYSSVDLPMLLSLLVICLVIETIADMIQSSPLPSAPPAILARLPEETRGDLVALCMQDHYVEVITTKGRSMLLMRLSDAIMESEPTRGLLIHRSNWVALDQVTEVIRSQGSASVLTRTGERLTVARQRLKDLAEAGLLPREGA